MSLLAEEIVEEWLNRQGYFTIRGIKLGVQEMDLLAIKNGGDRVECRHIVCGRESGHWNWYCIA